EGGLLLSIDANAVRARDVLTGEEVWSHASKPVRTSAPVFGDGVIFAVVEARDARASVLALDAKTGTPRWRYDVPDAKVHELPPRSLVIDGDRLLVLLRRKVSSLLVASGERRVTMPAASPTAFAIFD